MNIRILAFSLLISAAAIPCVAQQHSLQIDDGNGNVTIINASGSNSDFAFPPGSGTIVSTGNLSNFAWITGGDTLTGILPGNPMESFGSVNGADVIMKSYNTEQMRLLSTGGIQLPQTTAAGAGAFFQNGASIMHTYGTSNYFAGAGAGNFTMTGTDNSACGTNALAANTSGNFNTAAGAQVLSFNTTGSNNTGNGAMALAANNSGSSNTAMGTQSLSSNSIGSGNTATGAQSLTTNTTGNNNTAAGTMSLKANSTGNDNTATGASALNANVLGNSNTANGAQALMNSNADFNTAVGAEALKATTSGTTNTAVGAKALLVNVDGNSNTALGVLALSSNTSGSNNTAIGEGALSATTTSAGNTVVGENALSSLTSGDFNVAIGLQAGNFTTGGTGNIFIGHNADASIPELINATAIGEGAIVGQSNAIILGNNANVGIGTSTPNQKLEVTGNALVTGDLFVGGAHGIHIEEGANGTMGIATMVAGTIAVPTTKVTANSRIFLTIQSPAGTVGSPYVSARVASTGFTITSTSNLDGSDVAWVIIEP